MNIAIAKLELLENCKNREYREALNEENVYAVVCAQLRVLREQRNLSQKQLGRRVRMAQERVSILEDPNAETKPTLKTLLRLAAGLDVGLDVRFVPFSTILDRSTRTDEASLQVNSFEDEVADMGQEFILGLGRSSDLVADEISGLGRAPILGEMFPKASAPDQNQGVLVAGVAELFASATIKEDWERRAAEAIRTGPLLMIAPPSSGTPRVPQPEPSVAISGQGKWKLPDAARQQAA